MQVREATPEDAATWQRISSALYLGTRGLPGYSSLA